MFEDPPPPFATTSVQPNQPCTKQPIANNRSPIICVTQHTRRSRNSSGSSGMHSWCWRCC